MQFSIDDLRSTYRSLNNQLYSQLEKQVNNQLWVRLYVARIDTITSTLQATIQTQFNTLLYTEEELRDYELNKIQKLKRELNLGKGSGIEKWTTTTDYFDNARTTHVEKYNN